VYSSKFMSDDEATDILLSNLDGEPLASPRPIRFLAGKRNKSWNKNCVSIGLAAGFLEPLESTSLHLIHMGIAHLVAHFPASAFDQQDIDHFNRTMDQEFEWVRDFIILHYKATERGDSPFWNHCREMEVPESLMQKVELFRTHGRVFADAGELFKKMSWLQVMHGQRVRPRSYHPLVDVMGEQEVQRHLDEVKAVIQACVASMPTHAHVIAEYCAAAT